MSKLHDREGNEVPVMGHPMGPADFSAKDFVAKHPLSGEVGIPFGIDPTETVELTVINLFGMQVVHTFNPGANPYFVRAIKQDAAQQVVVNYYI